MSNEIQSLLILGMAIIVIGTTFSHFVGMVDANRKHHKQSPFATLSSALQIGGFLLAALGLWLHFG